MQLFQQPPRQYVPAVIPNDVPVYKVGDGKFYVDDELLNEGAIITWEEEPNPNLIPMNKMAVDRMRAYLTQLDVYGEEKAKQDKKKYVPLLKQFNDRIAVASGENRRARVLNGAEEQKSVLGKKRGASRIQKLDGSQSAEEVMDFSEERDAVNNTTGTGMTVKAGKLNG